ncbi:MAG: hypothetical protein ABIK89_26395 [Planctomycetota bacterium]
MADNDKELAKQIILEIVRQAGGTLTNKTNLYKAFYHAHLRFAETQPSYLSAWPIVRMPRGPGIDRFDVLLGELMAEGKLETKEVTLGEYRAFRFMLLKDVECGDLPVGAVDAIAYGVAQVEGKAAERVSRESHDMSRAWREAEDGEELNIYTDLLSDEEYQERIERSRALAEAMGLALPRR